MKYRFFIRQSASAFTLIELIAVVAILSILLIVAGTAATSILKNTKRAECIGKMRSLGIAILQYSQDNSGEFPRSGHSAAALRKTPWSRALLPYLDLPEKPDSKKWIEICNSTYRCPADTNTSPYLYSYGMNVYFELRDGDDYEGAPATWHRYINVPHPGKTILLAEPRSVYFGDHIMVHQWKKIAAAKNSLDCHRHKDSSNYLFVDGHVASMKTRDTFDPQKGINLWNPMLAGQKNL
ncbi:MAG: prepilin-type N-terminal cleavage/methylation domain-containing protein [Chthoniobacterales bacterium]